MINWLVLRFISFARCLLFPPPSTTNYWVSAGPFQQTSIYNIHNIQHPHLQHKDHLNE